LSNLEISEEGIEQIYEFSAGIPFYVQFIGKMLKKKEGVTIEDIKEIEDEFLREEGDLPFRGEFNDLSSRERLVILQIAKGCHTPKEIATIVKDKVSNVGRFLAYLEDKEYISKREKGYYALEDPVFGKWLGMR